MDLLPDEMLLHIMSFLSPQELLQSVACVCRRWEDLALNVALWAFSSGFCYHTPGSAVPSAACTPSPSLRTLALQGRDDADGLLRAWRGCATLRRLDLDDCRLRPATLRALVGDFPQLSALSLRNSGHLSAGLDYRLLAALRRLRSLNLACCKGVGQGVLRALADGCPELEELRLDWVSTLSDADVEHLVARLGPQLRVLALGGEALTDRAYAQLARCTRLREVGVAPCGGLTDQGLLAGLSALQELRVFNLVDAGSVSAGALAAFFHRSPAAAQLESVAFAWCPAVDDALLELISSKCPALAQVGVRHSQLVTDRGVCALLRGCRSLQSLSLVWNDRLRGTTFLPLITEHVPQLRHLDLGYCDNISKEAFNTFITTRGNIKVTGPEVWCRPRKSKHTCCGSWSSAAS